MSLAAPPLSLYVHLPWCVRKCPYCDFNSHAAPARGIPEEAYLAALLDDLGLAARDCEGRPLVSIFFGGGTPSLFSATSIGRVIDRAVRLLGAAGDLEVTLEANPGTVERGRFAAYRDAGVTRVSLGAQSFDDRRLRDLGRIHARDETMAAVEELRATQLDNFNLDLMYALPRQTHDEAFADLEQAIALEPAHISHYHLTLEPGTVFERRPPPLPDEDAAYAMQDACQARLRTAGYRHYEVSAYAQPGRECRHNLNYWRFGDYLGIGAGAHGKITDVTSGAVLRTSRVRQPARYLAAADAGQRIEESRVVAPSDLAFEFCLNALRLTDGFDAASFESRTGQSWSSIAAAVSKAQARGLLEPRPDGRWVPTALGRSFLNDLQAMFLPEGHAEAVSQAQSVLASPPALG
jgi:oxygen-independent coproporphyrinogen-3 oxidase